MRRSSVQVTVGLLALAGSFAIPQSVAQATTETGTDQVSGSEEIRGTAAARCGESLRFFPNNLTGVVYRHCTSGRDSVRVRAIIKRGADGRCTTVGPNEEKIIHFYGGISSFDRIDRC
jgi:hypothetical protein